MVLPSFSYLVSYDCVVDDSYLVLPSFSFGSPVPRVSLIGLRCFVVLPSFSYLVS